MTFRKITFIFIAVLLSLLFLLQFWLIQNFTQDVSSKIGQAAFEVSRSTIKTLIFEQPKIEFKALAISTKISEFEQIRIINSLSRLPSSVDIHLKDGQNDKFLTIKSSGKTYKIDIPRTGIEKSLDSMSKKILMSAVAFIFIGLMVASYFSKQFSQPLKNLQNASVKVGRGDFGFQIKNQRTFQSIELKNTIQAFNEMSNKIERLQKENELLQKRTQLSELSEITRGLAHTIRNPLNTLTLAIDQLHSSTNHDEKKELNRIAKHQVNRIDRWVRSLMDVMSSDASLVENTNLEQLLQTCIDDLILNNTSSIKVNLVVIHENKNSHPFSLNVISPELKSLLQGLISNAIEATETASPAEATKQLQAVTVSISKPVDAIEISIKDHGDGFSDKVRAKLFSPHNTNKTYGAGMGLYLAHQIITLKYNGNIVVKNNVQQGLPDNASPKMGTNIVLTLNDRV